MTDIQISAPVLRWAQRRSGRNEEEIHEKFSGWDDWVAARSQPSFTEIEKISEYTRVPIGYFFLPEPPTEELPISDFRVGRGHSRKVSSDLLETIYVNQRRQAWYEEYLVDLGETEPLNFVGSAREMTATKTAQKISEALDFSIATRQELGNIDQVKAHLVSKFEELGGLVVVNSMVGNVTHRMLDLDEFRGFTLYSLFAPLIFINSNDTKNGQIFSLLHEFAHVWRGDSGISQGGDPLKDRNTTIERWCDDVAAEIAVPASDLMENYDQNADLTNELDRLTKRYRCSTLVILIKLRDTNILPPEGFAEKYNTEVDRLVGILRRREKGGSGNFYYNQPYRIGRKLSRALIEATYLGKTSMTEALRLMQFNRIAMFDKYALHLESS